MTKYLIDVEDQFWQAFKTVAVLHQLKVKEAVLQALTEYIQNHQTEQVKIDVQVIQNNKRDLLTFIYEEQIKELLQEMLKAKAREAPPHFIQELKTQTLGLLKKHPALSKDLADEVVTVFKNLT